MSSSAPLRLRQELLTTKQLLQPKVVLKPWCAAAASYASRGLRINAVAPSLTDTPLSQAIVGSEQALEISKRMHPAGAIGEASDVASLAAWLHSDQAKFVTGQTFVIDGGISKIVPKPKA